ncbi:hypothetical protein SAMN05216419_10608 [Nitrosomonas cryotolerans]|uniref:UPF0125 protein SAMN02743940_1462 n=1 Tax=Nitrosomonas cryotolerans ATCC 49181 TaxID=1131553 RepID=A0A1N6I080_9PROT|nr:RnfH family protein [Nitrosomonas cryotolerans]SFQ09300.1 hypothetical protein SAMN05216419_10608 [Nitrosomonas cryotolerans]SIO25339.1 hypothetical protein SAMN02743940_1462 [Nitrosomonas cryotolerans ATCC 49181]
MENHDKQYIDIEVAYALPRNQILKRLSVPAGTTVTRAIILSEIITLFPDIDLAKNKLGIFSQFVDPETILRHRDRVEIYRAVIVNPKEMRRKRAMKKTTQNT